MNFDTIIAKRERKTLYRDGDRRIKVFEEGYPKADVFNEALNQARVEETELNVPKLLEVTLHNGRWVVVSEYIEGRTLAELMQESPGKTREYIDLMVDLQLKVHAQSCPLLTNLRDKMFRKISLTDYDEGTKYELQTRLNGMPRHNKVCHGDFRPSNIIISPEGAPYIIDWSHVTQGNASADVARTYLLYLLEDQKGDGEYYLNRFCEKTDTARQYVEKWIPIVAASQSVKGNQRELAFLHSIVDVVDYE
jgi:RIO-like serine/threonine protein kinase